MRLLLLAFWVAFFCFDLRAEEKKEEIPVYGEIQFAELLQNPEERQKIEGKIIDLVGDLYSLNRVSEERPNVEQIGFGKTYQTVIYRVNCQLSKPLSKAEFDRISKSSFVVVRGRCTVTMKTKEIGTDVWYDFSIQLADAAIRYWEPAKVEPRDK
jgi:hypothetical protein